MGDNYAFPKKWAKVGETLREFRRRCKKLTKRARWYAKRRKKQGGEVKP